MGEITINGVKCNGVEVNGIKVGDNYYIFSGGGSSGGVMDDGYTVTFKDGSDVFAVVSVKQGTSINTLLTHPDEDSNGHAFLWWATSATDSDSFVTFPYTPTADTTLYAIHNVYVGSPLEAYTWAQIRAISDAGSGSSLFAVGDTKSVAISGTVGTLAIDETVYVYILGFDHNADIEGYNTIHFQGFKTADGIDVCYVDSGYNATSYDGTKYFNMNHWGSSSSPYNTNYGGWAGCDMRYDILGSTDVAPSDYGATATTSRIGYNPSDTCTSSPVSNTLMAALPSDLRAVLKPTTKYTDNKGNSSNTEANVTATIDYLFLLAEYEIFGTRSYANTYEQNYQAQYAYYANGNSKIKYRRDSVSTAAIWWERSAYYHYATYFCGVSTGGTASTSTSRISIGLAPAFVV